MTKTRAAHNPSSEAEKKKKKKSKSKSAKLSGPGPAAMKPAPKPNPFDAISSRRKFDILGRRQKGEHRLPGHIHSLAVEKRKKTLQKEYEQSVKASRFVDNRIGEKDDTLPEFDKAIMRLQRERQLRLKRASKYNLSDGEEDDPFTHETHALSKMDDFEDEISLDEDEDASMENGNIGSQRHLSLGMGVSQETTLLDEEENNHKTKKQVMQEIILKSKFYKAQKAKDKEEDEYLMEKLDNDFTSLAQSEALLSLTQPNKMNALKALLNKDIRGQSTIKGSFGFVDTEPSKKEKPDAYDKLVKEMVLDMRARPSDRTKTPEEIAQEERERLELLEEERKKRMLSTDDSSEEDSDADEDNYKSTSKKFRSASGDDLGDSFSADDDRTDRKGWIDDIYERENAGDESGSGSDESQEGEDDDDDDNNDDSDKDAASGDELGKLSSVKDWEQSDDDDLVTDGEDAEEPDEKQTNVKDAANKKSEKSDSFDSLQKDAPRKVPIDKQDTLPFVIEAPSTLAELCALLDNRSDAEVIEAIKRIRACNSINLAVENRKKMQVFYGVLLQYFAVLATRRPLNFKLLDSLVKPLIEMSVETPFFAAICARQRLIHIRTQFVEDIKIPEKSSWPTLKTLLLLRLWSMIFPCSDFRHVVMTPAILLMCEYLMRCRILSGRDVAIGSLLCSMVFSVAKQSRKLCPEALIFLQTLLMSALESESLLQQHSQFYYLVELRSVKPWLHMREKVCDVRPIDFLMLVDMESDSPYFQSDNFKASILASVVETLRGFVGIYEGVSSFAEIFLPISALLHEVGANDKIPGSLQDSMEDVVQLIKKKSDEHQILRQPLQMRREKTAPIKLLNPKFEENFVKGRDYDPDRERSERKKLRKKLKREAKGAARELRKDNHFIFGMKVKKNLIEEEERAERYGKARAFLQEQEHAFKSGQLGKGRKRR